MKKISAILSLNVLFFLSAYVSSEELPFQMSGGLTFSAFDDNMHSTEMLGYHASVGYNIDENILVEAGYSDLSAFSGAKSDTLKTTMLEASYSLPVSRYASFYTGVGGAFSNDDSNLTLSLGIKYKLGQSWYADLGYQGMFDVASQDDDLYSLNMLLVYRFSNNASQKALPETTPSNNVGKSIVASPVLTQEPLSTPIVPEKKDLSCHQHLVEYQVVSGDHLYQLAREFDISIDELVEANKKFNNRNLNLIYPGEEIVYPQLRCLD